MGKMCSRLGSIPEPFILMRYDVTAVEAEGQVGKDHRSWTKDKREGKAKDGFIKWSAITWGYYDEMAAYKDFNRRRRSLEKVGGQKSKSLSSLLSLSLTPLPSSSLPSLSLMPLSSSSSLPSSLPSLSFPSCENLTFSIFTIIALFERYCGVSSMFCTNNS